MIDLLDTTIEDLKNGTLIITSEEVKYPKTINKKAFSQRIYFAKNTVDGSTQRINKKVRLQMMQILEGNENR